MLELDAQVLPLPMFEFISTKGRRDRKHYCDSNEFKGREGNKTICGVLDFKKEREPPIDLFVVYDQGSCYQNDANDIAQSIEKYLQKRGFEQQSNQTLMLVKSVLCIDMENEQKMDQSMRQYDQMIKRCRKPLLFVLLPNWNSETDISRAKQDLTRILTLDQYQRGYLTQFLLYTNKRNVNAVWGSAEDCLLKGNFKLYKMYLNLKNEDRLFRSGNIWAFGFDTTKPAGNDTPTVFTVCGAREPLIHSMKGYEFGSTLIPNGTQIPDMRCVAKAFEKVMKKMVEKQAQEGKKLSIDTSLYFLLLNG